MYLHLIVDTGSLIKSRFDLLQHVPGKIKKIELKLCKKDPEIVQAAVYFTSQLQVGCIMQLMPSGFKLHHGSKSRKG
jgi:hypothetical protein